MAGTAANAEYIYERLDAAFWDIIRARRAMDDVVRLIHEREYDAADLVPPVESIQGFMDVTRLALVNSRAEWRGYAQDREQG